MFEPALPIGIKHIHDKDVFVHDANGFYLFTAHDWQIAEFFINAVNNHNAEIEQMETTMVGMEEEILKLQRQLESTPNQPN